MTPETAIKKQVKDWLNIKGWFNFPILQGLGAYKGIPDIIAIKDGNVLFIEVKSKTGKMNEDQKAFMRNICEQYGHYIIARGYEDIEAYKERLRNLVDELEHL